MKPADESNDLCENTNIKSEKRKGNCSFPTVDFSRKIHFQYNVGSGRVGKLPRFQYQGLNQLLCSSNMDTGMPAGCELSIGESWGVL